MISIHCSLSEFTISTKRSGPWVTLVVALVVAGIAGFFAWNSGLLTDLFRKDKPSPSPRPDGEPVEINTGQDKQYEVIGIKTPEARKLAEEEFKDAGVSDARKNTLLTEITEDGRVRDPFAIIGESKSLSLKELGIKGGKTKYGDVLSAKQYLHEWRVRLRGLRKEAAVLVGKKSIDPETMPTLYLLQELAENSDYERAVEEAPEPVLPWFTRRDLQTVKALRQLLVDSREGKRYKSDAGPLDLKGNATLKDVLATLHDKAESTTGALVDDLTRSTPSVFEDVAASEPLLSAWRAFAREFLSQKKDLPQWIRLSKANGELQGMAFVVHSQDFENGDNVVPTVLRTGMKTDGVGHPSR